MQVATEVDYQVPSMAREAVRGPPEIQTQLGGVEERAAVIESVAETLAAGDRAEWERRDFHWPCGRIAGRIHGAAAG